jgi:hypothetical protein
MYKRAGLHYLPFFASGISQSDMTIKRWGLMPRAFASGVSRSDMNNKHLRLDAPEAFAFLELYCDLYRF